MTLFQYQGRNENGKLVKGQVDAGSEELAATHLLSQSITPLHIRPKSSAYKANLQKMLRFNLFGEQVKTEELSTFCRQMFTLTKAGVPVIQALTQLAKTAHSPTLKECLNNAADTIANGQTLTVALKKHPAVFSKMFTSIIDSGENSGQLDESFEQLASYLDLEAKTAKRVKAATRYPLMVTIAIGAALGIINFMVVPAFTKMFEAFNAELPLPTRILMGTSNFMINHWLLLLAAIIVIIFGIKVFLGTTEGRLIWDRAKLKVPVFGNLSQKIILTRFSRTFSIVLRTGIPLEKGIALVSNVVGNEYVRKRILTMKEKIENGETLSKAAIEANLFSPLVLQMLEIGEASGEMDALIEEIAEFYEREVDYDLERLGDLIEPILLIIMASMVLVLALGVFLPMWDMVGFIKK
jgi:MSHA biogenesis protein MshG